jgi:peptidoglycan/xylan/chitin deacetylase (PgdA/CDA1 family)
MILAKFVFATLAVCIVMFAPSAFAQEKTGTLEVFIKTEGNDRVAPEGISIKIYKDQEKTPAETILLENNPFTVSSLPQGHEYRVEVYINGMFAEVGFVDLKNQARLDITTKNSGGMLLSVFYNDGKTPLPNAKVWIKSYDGKGLSYSETDENGQTIRTWLHPTLREGDYYYAEISLDSNLKYVHSPILLQPGLPQEFKVVTNWPAIVDKLITIEVYNSTKNKVAKQDGTFVAQLFDTKKNKIAESKVTDKGLAHFSNLKVSTYALYIKAKDDSGQLNAVAAKKLTITDATNVIKIYVNNPELNSDHLVCNCVAFRLDDIQDYYLAPAQMAIISLFEQKNVSLTIGVIGGTTGADQNLVSAIKTSLANDSPIEIASHSWNNKVLSTLSKKDQDDLIKKTNDKIESLFGLKPTTFIPPENLFNNDTISVLKENGFTHISYATVTGEPPAFKKSSFYHFPTVPSTARLDAQTGVWHPIPNDRILSDVEQSLFDYGYAVVMMHPYEFSAYENGFYTNKVNTTKIQELGLLIDKIQSDKIKILPIGSIQDYDVIEVTAKPVQEQPELQDCNCVAFRMDNIQDFWLNEVQNTVIDTFDKNDVPLTISVIGKFIGDDPSVVGHINEKLNKTSQLRIANRGWEYLDHTAFDTPQQIASIEQTNEKINKVFGTKASIFAPPYDAFNKKTIEAAKQAKISYFSASIATDRPPFAADQLKHVPSTVSFANLADNDPFLSGTQEQKALTKVQQSIKQHGFAVISLQPSDFATKIEVFENKVDAEKLSLLESIIRSIKSNGINAVMLEKIPHILEERSIVIPEWVKNNAGWWAGGQIEDSDFTKGLEYLIEQNIIKIPSTQAGESISQKIPAWVKNNAGWWADGQIGNADFVRGIQYLIENGVIRV